MKNKKIIRIISVFLIAAVSSLFLINYYSGQNSNNQNTYKVYNNERYDNDKILGNINASLTLIEYGSLTCIHCANFHTNEFVTLKNEFIDTGKIKYIYRHFPLDKVALVLSYVAEKIPEKNYYDFIMDIYKDQDSLRSLNSTEYLKKVTNKYLTEDELNKILNDPNGEALIDKIVSNKAKFIEKFEVEGTPTFYLYGPNNLNMKLSKDNVKDIITSLNKTGINLNNK